jgi:hypothetical protein
MQTHCLSSLHNSRETASNVLLLLLLLPNIPCESSCVGDVSPPFTMYSRPTGNNRQAAPPAAAAAAAGGSLCLVLLLVVVVVLLLLLLLLLLLVVMGAISGSGAISSMRSGRRWESRLKGLKTGSDSANSGGQPPSFGGLGMMGLTSTGSS